MPVKAVFVKAVFVRFARFGQTVLFILLLQNKCYKTIFVQRFLF